MTSSETGPREHDVVLFGATGFVGRLTAEYLARSAPAGARIALAARSRDRLAEVRDGLGPAAAGWALLVADSSARASLDAMARSAQVVATTVGPYARHGLPLVEACAHAGTSYADLTGEVLFVRESIDDCHETAAGTGARIVHACGFDSIPSDLGVLLLAEQARADDAGELEDTTLVVRSMRGGISGGTVDSMRNQVDTMLADAGKRRLVLDPYSLSPDRSAEPDLGAERDPVAPGFDPQTRTWTAPFVMGTYNTRVVRRSNALTGHRYGRRFRYKELMSTGRSPVAPLLAGATVAGLGSLAAGMALPPVRAVLDRVLPAPGTGPSEQARRNGHFRMEISTRTSTGVRYVATVAAKGDPGYAATSVMLGESALCLALDRDRLPDAAGVLTPATAMGTVLVDRLRAAGFTFEVARR